MFIVSVAEDIGARSNGFANRMMLLLYAVVGDCCVVAVVVAVAVTVSFAVTVAVAIAETAAGTVAVAVLFTVDCWLGLSRFGQLFTAIIFRVPKVHNCAQQELYVDIKVCCLVRRSIIAAFTAI